MTRPLGRTVGLVAPTAAEYRLLGPNEPFLAAVRTATGGAEVTTPLDPWVHDLDHDQPVHRPVAAAARPGAAAVAARHRPAARVGRATRVRGGRRLGPRTAAPTLAGRRADDDRGGPHRRPRTGLVGGCPGRDPRGNVRSDDRRNRGRRLPRRRRWRPRHLPNRRPRPRGPHRPLRPGTCAGDPVGPAAPSTPAAPTAPDTGGDTMARLRDAKRRARER